MCMKTKKHNKIVVYSLIIVITTIFFIGWCLTFIGKN